MLWRVVRRDKGRDGFFLFIVIDDREWETNGRIHLLGSRAHQFVRVHRDRLQGFL